MSPLEQYMKTCKKKTGRFIPVSLPGKEKLRSDRQWLTVQQMANKYGVSINSINETLSRYGIEAGMRYKYQGTLRKYQ